MTNNYEIKITEKDLSRQIENLLNIFSWRWCHFRAARTELGWRTAISGHKGFVDYVAVRSGICLFIELKSEKGKLSAEQVEWASELKDIANHSLGVMYFCWRPSDIENIAQVLR